MRVVVFGGTGFVGLNIAAGLLAAGHEVVVFDRNAPPAAFLAEQPRSIDTVTADIRDPAAVDRALDGADAAVYGATITSGAEREADDPRSVLEVNLMGWLGVLEAARRQGSARLVNLSSSTAYGAAAFGPGPLDEAATAPDPTSLYGITKFAGERVAERLHALWDLDVVNVRLSSVFGPWERGTGVRDTLSPPFQVMRAALAGAPVRLERADARDWIYAPDVARGVAAILTADGPAHRLYNLTPGRVWAVADWARHLAAHHFPRLEVAIDPEHPTVLSHMPQERRPLASARLAELIDLETTFDLPGSADHYAAWAKAHADFLTG